MRLFVCVVCSCVVESNMRFAHNTLWFSWTWIYGSNTSCQYLGLWTRMNTVYWAYTPHTNACVKCLPNVYCASEILSCSFICIFQLFWLIADISVWYIRKVNSIARSMRGDSCSYDYCERYTSWLNDIPPKQKVTKSSHLQCLWVVFMAFT